MIRNLIVGTVLTIASLAPVEKASALSCTAELGNAINSLDQYHSYLAMNGQDPMADILKDVADSAAMKYNSCIFGSAMK